MKGWTIRRSDRLRRRFAFEWNRGSYFHPASAVYLNAMGSDMVVYEIRNGHIRLRQATGDQFEFAIVGDAEQSYLRLARPPRWAVGANPLNAEIRVYLAQAAARAIAQRVGLLS